MYLMLYFLMNNKTNMNKILLLISITLVLFIGSATAQIAVNSDSPDPSSALDIYSGSNNRGLLIPQMTTAQKLAIINPAPGLLIYDTDYNCISQYKDTPSNPGIFGWTCQTLFNRHFIYMPSINIPTSDGSGNILPGTRSIDLYSIYRTGFDTPPVKSTGAPSSIPYFDKEQLYFYVTYCDPCITVTGVSDAGVLSYTVNSLPNYDAFVNIVFSIR